MLPGSTSRPHPTEQLGVGLLLGAAGQAQHYDFSAAAKTFFSEMRTDKAGAAGDQQSHPNRSASAATILPLARPSPYGFTALAMRS